MVVPHSGGYPHAKFEGNLLLFKFGPHTKSGLTIPQCGQSSPSPSRISLLWRRDVATSAPKFKGKYHFDHRIGGCLLSPRRLWVILQQVNGFSSKRWTVLLPFDLWSSWDGINWAWRKRGSNLISARQLGTMANHPTFSYIMCVDISLIIKVHVIYFTSPPGYSLIGTKMFS